MKSEDDVVRREGLSVGPTDPRTEMEGEGFVVWGDIPTKGKTGFHLLSDGVVADKGIQKEADESTGGGVFRDEGVESRRLARGGVDEDTSTMSRFNPGSVDPLWERGILPHYGLFWGAGDKRGNGNKGKKQGGE